jgi:bifunctional N-acetylglucosamine-1-phosphate-uridyltransferase/glucosamine-1-phosphate-acetyltransferase GlmU-like protein
MNNITTVILAGGLGKRMNSDLPKVLHIINEIPMICNVIDRALDINSKNILIIVGKYKTIIQETILKYYEDSIFNKLIFIEQYEPLGTGNALYSCYDWIKTVCSEDSRILILSGDVPLITNTTLTDFINYKPFSNTLIGYELEVPKGYGRLLINNNDYIERIIEEKDCSELERNIKIVNCGIYLIKYSTFIENIGLINNNNAAKEYYLTDIIGLSYLKEGFVPFFLEKDKYIEIANINTKEDLENIISVVKNPLL